MPPSASPPGLREPDIFLVPHELRSLWRAGCRRPLLALVCAALVALLVGKLVVGRAPQPSAAVTIRLLQLISDEDTRPLSRVELETYINKVVLTQSNLAQMYKTHLHEGPQELLPDAQDIAGWIRDQTKVEVMSDRKLSLFSGREHRRSATIQITVEDDSVAAARRVAQGLANLVTAQARQTQAQALKLHALSAKEASRRASRQVERARSGLAQLRMGDEPQRLPQDLRRRSGSRYASPPPARANVVVVDNTKLVRPQNNERQWRVAWARAARAEAAEYQAWMRWQSELHVPTVQASQVAMRTHQPAPRSRTLGTAMAVAFFVALPLAFLCVGAFSSRIEEPFDLSRQGLACLGEVLIPRGAHGRRAFRV